MDVPTTDFRLFDDLRIHGFIHDVLLQCLRTGIISKLADGPCTPEALAEAMTMQPHPVEALLEMLACAGVLDREPAGYSLTPATRELLTTSSPFFQGKAIALQHRFDSFVVQAFEELLRGQRQSRDHTDNNWSTEDGIDGTAQFALLGGLQQVVAFAAALPDFPSMRTLCDLGGNHGQFSMALLDRHPALQAELLDLPNVAAAMAIRIAKNDHAQRMAAIPCDFREDMLPQDRYDLMLASHVLYGVAQELPSFLPRLHAALRPSGWLVTHHFSPGEGLSPLAAKAMEFTTRMAGYHTHFIDVDMLQQSARAAGFTAIKLQSPQGPFCGHIVACQRG